MSRSTVLSKIELSYPDLLDRRVGSNLFMSSASQPVIAALAAERECSQAMIDTVPASVFVISSEFKLLRFNSTFAEEMDRKLGSQVTAGYDFLSLTGVGNPDRWRDLFARVFAGVPVLERWEVIVPGHSDVIEISAHPISRDSNVTEVAIYIKNLTADVRLAADYQVSMERAKLALESTESLAFDWDLVTKNIELTNLEGIVGFAPTQETCTSE